MSKLIVVCGLPGSGKTTFANALSKKLKITCLHKDIIKETLYDIFRGLTFEDSKKAGFYSIQLLFRLTEECVKNGSDLIVESPFRFEEDVVYFTELKKNYVFSLYFFICKIDSIERRKRFVNRLRHCSHHDKVENINNFNYCNMPGNKLELITNRPTEILVNQAVGWMGH